MKIAIADSCQLKFCRELKEHWEQKGHEVKYEWGGSEILAQWADLYYIDWFDNNIAYVFNWYQNNPNAKKPKFTVRVIDMDFWTRGVRSQEMVNFVDYWICIASHIENLLRRERDDISGEVIQWSNKLKLIKPGVNLDTFPLKTTKTDGFQLGMVLGDMWWYKNHMAGLDIFTSLYRQDNRWRLHIRGQHEGGQYNPVMYEHYLESRGIKDVVTLYGNYLDMNDFYEKIDILLHPGMKESFCYAVGEAMAKGIRAVVNEFYGSKDIWPEWILYQTHQEAIDLIKTPRTTIQGHQEYIRYNYSLERQLKETN